jgi:hypothetical protein
MAAQENFLCQAHTSLYPVDTKDSSPDEKFKKKKTG